MIHRTLLFLLLAVAAVASEPPPADPPESDGTPETQAATPDTEELSPDAAEQARQLSELARGYAGRGEVELAEDFLGQLLNLDAPDAVKRDGLVALADLYGTHGPAARAVAVYERIARTFEGDPILPDVMLKLGYLYRQSGAFDLAIARFYSVLNSTLHLGAGDVAEFKQRTLRAQLEIAETHHLAGNYSEASRFYGMVLRLDLMPEDRARAAFRQLACLPQLGRHAEAVIAARELLKGQPENYEPETRHLLILSLRALNRKSEAVTETLELLRVEHGRSAKAPEAWEHWQKTTGNDIANELYLQGDFMKALAIYRALAQLKSKPDWQWPVIYQMGLCFERLRLFDRADEAYAFIGKEAEKQEELSEPLASCVEMAKWRRDQIAWLQTTEKRLTELLAPPPPSDIQLPDNARISLQ